MGTDKPDEKSRSITKEDHHPLVRRPYGGYWDKLGNRFEDRWVLHKLVEMTGSTSDIESLEREPVGEDEVGIDLWINRRGGWRECHQCKRAREGRASWSMRELHREGIFGHLKFQLERDPSRHLYRLVSGTPAGDFEGLLREARDSRDAETFWIHHVKCSSRLRSAFSQLGKYLELATDHVSGRQSAWRLLRGSGFILFRDDEHTEASLVHRLGSSLKGDPKVALALLETWLRSQLRARIDLGSVSAHLQAHGFRLIHGDTDRFQIVAAALARKRAQQGRLLEFEAELAELKRQAAEQGQERIQVIGERWRLIRKIGSGGIADVWLGEDRPSKPSKKAEPRPTLAAIKILRAHKAHDESLLQKFIQGAERIKAVVHPTIPLVLFGPSYSDGRHYYVMEYVDAPTLKKWIGEKQVPFASSGTIIGRADPSFSEALWLIITAVAGGLSALHKKDLIHGDVKPSNILVDNDGRVKLCDFDLVQRESDCEPLAEPMGTMPFLAPEVRHGRASTALSDQFSFATTLVAILSEDGQINRDAAELLRSLACSNSLKRCLERALAHDPRERYETIEDFMAGLGAETFMVGDGGHTRR